MVDTWTTIETRSLLKDRWIDLRADDCRTSSGREVNPFYVLSYPDWVNIVALTLSGDMVLVRQYRHAAGAVMMEIPAGAVDRGDSSLEYAARRELLEETGYSADRFELIASLYPNPSSHTNRIHTFLARDAVRVGNQTLDPGEEGLDVHLVPVTDVLDRLRTGYLGQSMHVSSVVLALMAAGHIVFPVR